MSQTFVLKKGLNIPVAGEAELRVSKTVAPGIVAVQPTDFKGFLPRLLVKEGDRVLCGSPVMADKKNADILLTFTESEDGSPGDRTYLKGKSSGYFRANITPSIECDVDAYDFSFRFRSHDPTNNSPDQSALSSLPIYIASF